MSLLFLNQNDEIHKLAEKVFDRQFELDDKLDMEFDELAKQKMYQDVLYNISFLDVAVGLKDPKIFENYAKWIYELLLPLIQYCTKERVMEQMNQHYDILAKAVDCIYEEEELIFARAILTRAKEVTEATCKQRIEANQETQHLYQEEAKQYLNTLLEGNTTKAVWMLKEFYESGISMDSIYIDIVQVVMRNVGELWHSHEITVDKEHYCTSTTQAALAQLYPYIFAQERKGKKIVMACIGSELHEMGARMVSDIFEYHGWDSIHLGAAVPNDTIEQTIEEQKPDLLALSVTMPQYLQACLDCTNRIKKQYPKLRIAVGGRAFTLTDMIWERWNVDVYTRDARELVEWADANIHE